MENAVFLSINNQIGTLQINNSALSNALSRAMMTEIADNLELMNRDDSVRVIVIQSQGQKAFCAGASLKELSAVSSDEQATHFFSGFAHILIRMQQMKKLIIARVQGKVVGGGLGIVAGCDYVIAHQNAAIKLSELSMGIGPFVIAPALTRKIGTTAFEELSLAATQWRDANWSMQKGLYAEIAQDFKTLDKKVQERANEFAAYPIEAVKILRAWHWKNTANWQIELFENAAITGKLARKETTQSKLKLYFKNER